MEILFYLTKFSIKSMICITIAMINDKRERRIMKSNEGKYAWTVTVGTKGQIVIPKEARELFQIKPGDHLILLADINKGMAIPPKQHFEEFYNKLFENNIK